jgi:MFS family permease
MQLLPVAVLGPLAGRYAETRSKSRILIATCLVSAMAAATLGVLILADVIEVWHIYLFALIAGIGSAVDAPIRQAFVRDLVGFDNIANAVGLNAALFHTARIVGPAIAGIMIDAAGTTAVQFVVVGLILLAAASLAMIRTPAKPDHVAIEKNSALTADDGSLRAAVRRITADPALLTVFALATGVFAVTLNMQPMMTLMVVQHWSGDASDLGLTAGCAAVGSIAGALLGAHRRTVGPLMVPISAILLGIAWTVAPLLPGMWLFAAALAPVGLFTLTYSISSNTRVQVMIGQGMQARVLALYLAACSIGAPVGALVLGFAADTIGPNWAMASAGVWVTLAAIAVALLTIRKFR